MALTPRNAARAPRAPHRVCLTRQPPTNARLDCGAALNEALFRSLLTLTEKHAFRAVDHMRVVVTGLCASWTARLSHVEYGDATKRHPLAIGPIRAPPSDLEPELLNEAMHRAFEVQILSHVLGVLTSLLAVSRYDLAAALRSKDTHAQTETPVVRRTLPAMRIGFKWVKCHLEYIARSVLETREHEARLSSLARAVGAADKGRDEALARLMAIQHGTLPRVFAFWATYASFIELLRKVHPFESLPNVGPVDENGRASVLVEEDIDLRELGPLRRVMGGSPSQSAAEARSLSADQSHSARILDTLIDAKVIAESDASPIHFDDVRSAFVYAPQEQLVHEHMPGEDSRAPLDSFEETMAYAMRALERQRGDGDSVSAASAPEPLECAIDGPAAPMLLFGDQIAEHGSVPVGRGQQSIWSSAAPADEQDWQR